MSKPKFGDTIIAIYASEDNPIRETKYVRTIYRNGRLNPGKHYETIDEDGKLHLFHVDNCKLKDVEITEARND